MFFRLIPWGLQWYTHMKCKRQIKLTSAMILRLVALSASSLPKDTLFPCKIFACRRRSSRPHVGDVGAAPGTREVLPGVSAGYTIFGNSMAFWGGEGAAFGRRTTFHHRL